MRPSCFFTVLCLIVTFSVTAQSDSASDDFFEVLTIEGVVSDGEVALEGASMELFEGNRKVETIETKNNGKFKFTLYDNLHYTIQTSKKGYQTKRIAIDTHVPEDFGKADKFDFDISMARTDEFTNVEETLLEYPATIIGYSEKKQEFTFDKKYTDSLRAAISTAE